ncbi:23S rRNA (pseudouridine(1915)-N(3))-methyltransferase RlmH [Rickettsia endosymbiont of Oedothorax gibbosus]|uniref:23S rRNA (pseudouridine(1915)-N(3))-methyltransferase RlmH n=1 Tax=Rickettsia endosymbiont of Oedothorax gibbosus TaxID=931099 RepID=UPI00202441A4|nr:23S rRNA (pseudouridine(1915)-N(3))-methyltransferase RlmH [Rickettsia endosymbiont of Oedothorax gibbosus]
MRQIQIISVGKLNNYYQPIARDYQKLIKYNIKSTEICYSKKLPAEQIKQFEGKLINEFLEEKSCKIVLNIIGNGYNSHEFTKLITNNLQSGKNIQFIIGGAFGLDKSILEQANIHLSLSKMTMPHQMAKIILLEQIYRTQTIIENHPYHK